MLLFLHTALVVTVVVFLRGGVRGRCLFNNQLLPMPRCGGGAGGVSCAQGEEDVTLKACCNGVSAVT